MSLEILYSPSFWTNRPLTPAQVISNHLNVIANKNISDAVPHILDIPYGHSQRQKIDIFGTDLSDAAPIIVFFHGGYWQEESISRRSYHFLADFFHKKAIKCIFAGYDLCPDVTLPEIIQQAGAAAQRCIKYAEDMRCTEMYFMGHSAGAHLVACILSTVSSTIVKGAFLVSGIYDLSPLLKTSVNTALKLGKEIVVKASPLRQIASPRFHVNVYCIVAEFESPAFIRQGEDFHKKLTLEGWKSELIKMEGVDHFNIMEGKLNSLIASIIIKQNKL